MGDDSQTWSLYIVRCRTGEFYVGIAMDVYKRVEQHCRGTACRYTKYRRPVTLIHKEICGSYAEARKREKEIKGFSRAKKIELIERSLTPTG